MNTLSVLASANVYISLASLLVLHLVSREFQPSWRMISEYATGKFKWLITIFFICWGLSSLFAAAVLWPKVDGFAAGLGLILLLIAGIGEIMGGLFDIKHKLHGLSFMLGVPALPIAALLLSYNLAFEHRAATIQLIAHATWISVLLMGLSMAHMFARFKKAGLPVGPEAKAPDTLPAGMVLFSGYANRLLVIVYHLWILSVV